jgi:hypothetical protein
MDQIGPSLRSGRAASRRRPFGRGPRRGWGPSGKNGWLAWFAIVVLACAGIAAEQAPPATPSAQTSSTVLPYEKPALDALARPAPPAAFPLQMHVASVPLPGHPGLVAIFVTVPGGGLSYVGDQKTGTFNAGAVVLARALDAAGVQVFKDSQEFPMRGLLAEAKTTMAKPLAFSRRADLATGHYRIEVAVYDQSGKQASVNSTPYDAPTSVAPIVGDLMVVDHADRLPPNEPEDTSNPFIVNHLMLHPAFDAGVNRSLQADVNFILPLVLAPSEPPPPVRLALLSESGEALAAVPLPIGAPDATGRLLAMGRIPLAKVPRGKYQLQVSVGIWPDARVRKTSLTVVD